jgi:hypothetical protein
MDEDQLQNIIDDSQQPKHEEIQQPEPTHSQQCVGEECPMPVEAQCIDGVCQLPNGAQCFGGQCPAPPTMQGDIMKWIKLIFMVVGVPLIGYLIYIYFIKKN